MAGRGLRDTPSAKDERNVAVLLELGQAVCSELDVDAVLRRTAEAARTLLEAQGGSVWQWDEARRELYVAAAVGLGVAAVVGARMKVGEAVVGRVVAEKKAIAVRDTLTDAVFGRAAVRVRESGIRALLNTPLLYRDEVLGVIGVYWESRRDISQRELDLAHMLANYAAIAIRNARTYEEVTASRRRLTVHGREMEVRNRISLAVASSLNLHTILEDVLDEAMAFMNMERAAVYVLDRANKGLRLEAHRGWSAEEAQAMLFLPSGAGVSGHVVTTGKHLVIDDISADPRVAAEEVRASGLKSGIVMPLKGHEKVLGVIILSTSKERQFAAHDVDLLATIGNSLGLAVENAGLYAEARLREEQARHLYRISRSVNSSLNLRDVLNSFAREAAEIVGVETCFVGLVQDDGYVRFMASNNMPEELLSEMRFGPGEGLPGQAIAESKVIYAEDAQDDARVKYAETAAKLGVRSTLAVPIIEARSKPPIGVLIMSAQTVRQFTEDEVHALQAVADLAAGAISNARLYAKVEEMASRDYLTNLLNRREFYRSMEAELWRAQRYSREFSVLILDLDGFKLVNDEHGHHIGDEVLKEFSNRLQASARKSDVVARFGGDEFAMVLPETGYSGALQRCRRIEQVVSETTFGREAGIQACLAVSVGVATFPQDGVSIDGLVAIADTRMYTEKRHKGQMRPS